jgi:hypothetical protein
MTIALSLPNPWTPRNPTKGVVIALFNAELWVWTIRIVDPESRYSQIEQHLGGQRRWHPRRQGER